MQPIPVYPGLRIETKESVNIILNETPCNLQNSQRLEALVDNCFVGKVKFCECIEKDSSVIYVQSLKNKTKTVRGIGTALIQKVIEISFERGFKGHVDLLAFKSSHVFYWKLGFRVIPDTNSLLREEWEKGIYELSEECKLRSINPTDQSVVEDPRMIKAREINPSLLPTFIFSNVSKFDFVHKKILEALHSGKDTLDIGYVRMYLPEESIRIWKNIINNPSAREENLKKLIDVPQIIHH